MNGPKVHCTCCFGVYNLQHPNADQYHWQGNFEEPNLRKGNIKMSVLELQFWEIFMFKTFWLIYVSGMSSANCVFLNLMKSRS